MSFRTCDCGSSIALYAINYEHVIIYNGKIFRFLYRGHANKLTGCPYNGKF